MPKLTCVTYMRCSGKGQLGGDTWERQMEAMSKCATNLGIALIHEYREEAMCGEVDETERPAFKEMVAYLMSNGCRLVMVERLDRLARAYRIQEQLIYYLAAKGIEVISADSEENVTQEMMADPVRKAIVQMQGIFAEMDKGMTVHKLRKARERKRKAGIRCEGVKPFGHFEREKPILARIAELIASGITVRGIAATLNAERHSTRSGKPWTGPTLQRIVKRVSQ